MATTSPLRQRRLEDMTIRNLSQATQQSYIYAVARFSRHFSSSPDQLGAEEVRAYQLHLVAQKHSWGHINQVTCASRFFYGVTLGQKDAIERIGASAIRHECAARPTAGSRRSSAGSAHAAPAESAAVRLVAMISNANNDESPPDASAPTFRAG